MSIAIGLSWEPCRHPAVRMMPCFRRRTLFIDRTTIPVLTVDWHSPDRQSNSSFMQRLFSLSLLFLLSLLVQTATAQDTVQQGTFVPNRKPHLDVRRTTGPITIDGNLNDPGWQGAAHAGNFAEIYPNEGAKPLVDTEVLVTYDSEYFYLGFICHDDPAEIRATMHDRDEGFSEDMVGISLDTYGDAARAYEIFSNARGIQGDVLTTTDGQDVRFDIVFHSQALVTAGGYQVEMAIPFSSLRFPDRPTQLWTATFWRIHPRASRREYGWAATTTDDPCQSCQYGTLGGITDVKPGGALELLPAVIAGQAGSLSDPNDPRSTFENGKIDFDAGLGVRYAITPSMSADVTINPDFSQVESDAAQIDVNTTFALSFPERRPFFQEGSDLFSTWIPAVYTRAINDPIVAGRISGRVGSTSFGYLGAYDQNSPIFLPFEESTGFASAGDGRERIESYSSLFRLKQSFDRSSHIGLLVTDRRLQGEGSGSVAAIDGQFRFLGNYQFEAQIAASHTVEPNDSTMTEGASGERFDNGERTVAFDGESFIGHGAYISVERGSRAWNFDVDYREYSPTFRTMNGIVTRNSLREASAFSEYTFFPDSPLLLRLSPSVRIGRYWNDEWQRKDEFVRSQIGLTFTAQTWIGIAYFGGTELFRGVDFPGIRRLEIEFNTNASNVLNGGISYAGGKFIARNIDRPVLGDGMRLDVWATFRPLEQLNIEPSFNYQTLDHPDGGENIFDEWVARVRTNFQFTRELSLRLVVQYINSASLLSLEPLATYKINPFTIFYAGSTQALQEYPQERGFTQRERQFFVKAQYLWSD